MSKLEFALVIFLAIILIAYLSFVSYLMMKIYKDGHKKSDSKDESQSAPVELHNLNSPFQTDFFNKSTEYAEKILFGKVFDPQYGESNYYGNKLIDTINKLNNETKKSVITAIKYLSIEPSQARSNEQLFRIMSEQEKVPLWFIILRESTKKVVPEFISEQPSIQKDNVIPLFQRTG